MKKRSKLKSRGPATRPAKSPKRGDLYTPLSRIKVVGIGGGGGNAAARMAKNGMRGVEFIAINTDHQDLDHCNVRHKVYIGKNLTKGLGTGMNPDLGKQAAEENRSEIAEAIGDADIVFIAAGLGGGTGTGGIPVVAEVARQSGALTLAFVTKPFLFEGVQRQRIAEDGLIRLKDKVDALVIVPNDKIFNIVDKDVPLVRAFEAIDEVLWNSLSGIVEMIMTPGLINIDFADVKAVMQGAGPAIVGVGIASGPERAANAVTQAMNSPLLEVTPEGAQGVVLGISGGRDLKMTEVNEAAKLVAQTVDPGAKIIFGAYHDRALKPNQVKVILIATGFSSVPGNSLFGSYLQDAKQGFFGGMKQPPDLTPSTGSGQVGSRAAGGDGVVRLKPAEAMKARDDEETAHAKEKEETPPTPATKGKGEKEKKEEASDLWDIPAFLRRRKR